MQIKDKFKVLCYVKLFKFKKKIDKHLVPMLVYKYEFNRCKYIYIGKKFMLSCKRAQGDIITFWIVPTSPPFSAIRKYLHDNLNES